LEGLEYDWICLTSVSGPSLADTGLDGCVIAGLTTALRAYICGATLPARKVVPQTRQM